jgi:GNAT superfamily N-acetyltransferase
MTGYRVHQVSKLARTELEGLCEVLLGCVHNGSSVGFMLPMTTAKAETFWASVIASVQRGERVLLLAVDNGGKVRGTAQVIWATAENQPHRAEVAKMLVHPQARRLGVGAALLAAVERAAADAGKTLLVLDTASLDAERLYVRGGWQRVGTIPNYALWPQGPPCATVVFYKPLD